LTARAAWGAAQRGPSPPGDSLGHEPGRHQPGSRGTPESGELACGGVGCEREPGAPKAAGCFVNRKQIVLSDDHVVQARTTLHSASAPFASAGSSSQLVPHASPAATVSPASPAVFRGRVRDSNSAIDMGCQLPSRPCLPMLLRSRQAAVTGDACPPPGCPECIRRGCPSHVAHDVDVASTPLGPGRTWYRPYGRCRSDARPLWRRVPTAPAAHLRGSRLVRGLKVPNDPGCSSPVRPERSAEDLPGALVPGEGRGLSCRWLESSGCQG